MLNGAGLLAVVSSPARVHRVRSTSPGSRPAGDAALSMSGPVGLQSTAVSRVNFVHGLAGCTGLQSTKWGRPACDEMQGPASRGAQVNGAGLRVMFLGFCPRAGLQSCSPEPALHRG